ncbi:MAG: phosphatidylcholine/phosphatidylserine synthase [Gammaproteobacteria bacterium]|nr:phosphatidylcholine/phosphatidylserine synthase [Gammaproteobacteria bacterium]QOJ31810.1 MAG: phosphatidylcholine/phosphatidylserine synthase [Gammaproteobacteria bacterium]
MGDPLLDDPAGTAPRPRRRGIYVLPNLLTTGSLFAGFYGIIASIDGRYEPAAIAVIVAGVLDGLDGRLARLTHTESEFGQQYDSLSDMVSFGLAPAVIVYQWGLVRLADYGWIWAKLGWLAAFIYAVAGALRLARFNVRIGSTDRRFFEGLPSPSAAGLMMSMVWLGTKLGWTGVYALALAFVVSSMAGLLMVSPFPYYSFKEIHARGRISFTYVFVVPLVFVLIAMDPPTVLFGIGVIYALSGPLLALWRLRRRHARLPRQERQTER